MATPLALAGYQRSSEHLLFATHIAFIEHSILVYLILNYLKRVDIKCKTGKVIYLDMYESVDNF